MSLSFRLATIGLLFGAALGGVATLGCSTSASARHPTSSGLARQQPPVTHAPAKPQIEVVFRQGKAYAREKGREWLISEVSQKEMLWAPDGVRFAYLKEQPAKSTNKRRRKLQPHFHLVIRNLRGDSVNEFPLYRRGRPSELDWIDNARLGYLAPPDKTGDVYVIHDAASGEIL